MLLADAVNDRAEDSGQRTPLLEQVQENCGRRPAEASADSQYNTGPELAKLEELGVTGYVAEVHQKSDGAAPPAAQQEALAAVRAGQELTEAQWAALPRNEHGYFDKAAFV